MEPFTENSRENIYIWSQKLLDLKTEHIFPNRFFSCIPTKHFTEEHQKHGPTKPSHGPDSPYTQSS